MKSRTAGLSAAALMMGLFSSLSFGGDFRPGMSWVVQDKGLFLSFDRFEVLKVENGKVTWKKTTLNKDKQPFAGDKGNVFTFPILKADQLAAGKEEEIEAAGRKFRCRRIESDAGIVWRSLEYPLISVRERVGESQRDLVEFNP